jgi:tetratricopeptide (TPR) repeat protein
MKKLSLLACLLFFIVSTAGALCGRTRAPALATLEHQRACVENIESEDYDAAQTRCELCLEYDQTTPECLNGLGVVAYQRGEDEKAISHFIHALRQNDEFAQARNNLGVIYFKRGDFEQALVYFLGAVKVDPGYQDARYNAGLSYLRLAQRKLAKFDRKGAVPLLSSAIEHYQKLLGVAVKHTDAMHDLGLSYSLKAKTEALRERQELWELKATEQFQNCVMVNDTVVHCHQSFGELLLRQAQFDKALYHFIQCLALQAKNAECVIGVDDAFQFSEAKKRGFDQYIAMLKEHPHDAEGHKGYCLMLFAQGANDLAVNECSRAIELDAKQCEARFELAMHYKRVINAKLATEHCRQFLLCEEAPAKPEWVAKCQRVITSAEEG